jgi:predicted enzyme related to lactoylglutathione lyase
MITNQPDVAADFYVDLFDWKIDADNPLNYRVIDTGSEAGIAGGIWPAPPEAHSFVQLFVEVDDVPRYVERATEMGAKVVVPHQVMPEGDEMAVIHDPVGIPVALYKPA